MQPNTLYRLLVEMVDTLPMVRAYRYSWFEVGRRYVNNNNKINMEKVIKVNEGFTITGMFDEMKKGDFLW